MLYKKMLKKIKFRSILFETLGKISGGFMKELRNVSDRK